MPSSLDDCLESLLYRFTRSAGVYLLDCDVTLLVTSGGWGSKRTANALIVRWCSVEPRVAAKASLAAAATIIAISCYTYKEVGRCATCQPLQSPRAYCV